MLIFKKRKSGGSFRPRVSYESLINKGITWKQANYKSLKNAKREI